MESAAAEYQAASVNAQQHDGALRLAVGGRLDAKCSDRAWRDATRAVRKQQPPRLILDLSNVSYCDTTGVGLILELKQLQTEAGREFSVEGASDEIQRLMGMFDLDKLAPPEPKGVEHAGPIAEVVSLGKRIFRDVVESVVFIGEVGVVLAAALANPRRLRWGDVFVTAERAGANALPIVSLIGFIMGLVMAFQATIPMRQFGMEIYIADMVAMVMFREMGPLTTAVLLAGRTGTAFAAEIGTMKINEEVDALRTMGLDPARFLIAPRVLAATLMTPLLAVFTTLLGLIGGAVVMLSLDFPAVTYWNRVQGAVEVDQVIGGLFKALVFGLIIAAVGCRRGLQTQTGPSAVGVSTTSAVVTSIILIVIADGIFAVVFYFLDI